MFNIKASKPQNKIKFYVGVCEYGHELPYPNQDSNCVAPSEDEDDTKTCGGMVEFHGSFWIKGEMITRQEIQNTKKTFAELFQDKIKDWGDLESDVDQFPCTDENKQIFYDEKPAIADYIVSYLGNRELFGLTAMVDYKKKLSKRKNGSLPMGKAKQSRQIVENA